MIFERADNRAVYDSPDAEQRNGGAMNRNSFANCLGNVAMACLLMAVSIAAGATTIYVSSKGNDKNDGLAAADGGGGSGPVATLDRALEALRTHPKATDKIVIAPGFYALTSPVRIGALESRPAGQSLSIEAAEPGTVIFTGGRAISGFETKGPLWVKQLEAGANFQLLWVDAKLATRARSPNGHEYFSGGRNVVAPVPEQGLPFKVTRPENIQNTKSLILPPAAQQALAKVPDSEIAGGVLNALHAWTSSSHEIASYDRATGRLDLKQPSQWPFFAFSKNQRFALENLPEFLDEPGEWWLSPGGELRYMPRPGETAGTSVAVAPLLEQLVVVSGLVGVPVENVRFRGIRFRHSKVQVVPFNDGQAAVRVPAAVTVDHARNIQFDDCAFEQLGGYGLWFRADVADSAVRRSLFRNLGAGGVRVGTPNLPPSDQERTRSIKIENNLIANGGTVFPGAVGIWIGQSGDNLVDHNEVRGFNYTGISVGWTWGFGPSMAVRNTIESNYVHRIGQNMLSDMGGIYLLGKTDGSVVRGNRIEDVFAADQPGATSYGIYLDEGSSDVLVEKNLVRRTTGGGFHLHFGKNNTVRNNIFTESKSAEVDRTKKEDATLLLEHNVLVSSGAPVFAGAWGDPGANVRNNLTVEPRDVRSRERPAGPSAQLECDPVNCRVLANQFLQSGFVNFSVTDAGIAERGVILNAEPR